MLHPVFGLAESILTFGPVMIHPGVIDGIKVKVWSLHDEV